MNMISEYETILAMLNAEKTDFSMASRGVFRGMPKRRGTNRAFGIVYPVTVNVSLPSGAIYGLKKNKHGVDCWGRINHPKNKHQRKVSK